MNKGGKGLDTVDVEEYYRLNSGLGQTIPHST